MMTLAWYLQAHQADYQSCRNLTEFLKWHLELQTEMLILCGEVIFCVRSRLVKQADTM